MDWAALGSAAPLWATPRSPDRPTGGPAVAVVAAKMGYRLMPWQRHVLDVSLEFDPVTREWAYPIVVTTVPRQAGKTTIITPRAIWEGMLRPKGYHWYTAQTRQDARDHFLQMMDDVEPVPTFRKLGFKVRRANGSEGLAMPGRAYYRVFNPSGDGLHGKTNRSVTVDEVWAFSEAAGTQLMQAIVPTFTTTGGQTVLTSTQGNASSVWLADWCARGQAAVEGGATSGVAYFHWGLPKGNDASDLREVLAAHPGAGFTLKMSALHAARGQLGAAEFARAYGNVPTLGKDFVIGHAQWAEGAATEALPGPGEWWLSLDAGLDETDGAIMATWSPEPGRIHCELMDYRLGVDWMAGRVLELAQARRPAHIVADEKMPGQHVLDAIRAGLPAAGARPALRGREVTTTTLQQYASACSGMLGAYAASVAGAQRQVTYTRHPALDAAAGSLTKRYVGDGLWVWGRRAAAASIAPFVAATVGVWAVRALARPAAFRIAS